MKINVHNYQLERQIVCNATLVTYVVPIWVIIHNGQNSSIAIKISFIRFIYIFVLRESGKGRFSLLFLTSGDTLTLDKMHIFVIVN